MVGTVEKRFVKEIYIADYDGENQRRVTTQMSLNINSTWSPDARSIAYASYRRAQPQIFISNIYQGTLEELTKGAGTELHCRPGRLTAHGSRLLPRATTISKSTSSTATARICAG